MRWPERMPSVRPTLMPNVRLKIVVANAVGATLLSVSIDKSGTVNGAS
jgi:hypothetical protein